MKKLIIEHSHDTESPREWSNLGIIAYKHSKYKLGDELINEDPIDYLLNLYGLDPDRFMTNRVYCNETLSEVIKMADKYGFVLLPVYLYDHSGQSISTKPFSCNWDSGQVGFIYANLKMCNDVGFEWKKWTKKRKDKIKNYLEGEIKTFNQYVSGEVYSFTIEEDGEIIDSCCGFYGDNPLTNGMAEHIDIELLNQYIEENNIQLNIKDYMKLQKLQETIF